MAKDAERITVELGGIPVELSHPDRVVFPDAGLTKLDLVRYYEAVADGALRGAGDRPNVMVRFVKGITQPAFYQKRVPESRPPFVDTLVLKFPSGREAEELVPRSIATLGWMVNLGCIELHPHPVRASDLEHPDELRIDLDPMPGVEWPQIQEVARVAKGVLDDVGLLGWPKTSGSRGIHILVRLEPKWGFDEVRRAALAIAREVEKRAPSLATSKWWKEERHGVFIDYNQNAKDRTVCSAYSVRPRPDARVSAPVTWDELFACDPADFTVKTMPARFAAIGDRHAAINEVAGSLEGLLAIAARHEAEGMGDAPWPPHYKKQENEPARVMPSRAKTAKTGTAKAKGTGKRASKFPLIEIARSLDKEAVLAGVERWKAKHPQAAALLAVDDVLVDAMRGRSSVWWRVRINLRHVPEGERPAQEAPDPELPENAFGEWPNPPSMYEEQKKP